jgi:Lantibiotic biosynthesis dehydratase C-term
MTRTENSNGSHWLFYKIYTGAAAGKMDHLVTGALREIAGNRDVTRWFFLRYTDEGGAHLRLRLQTAGDVVPLRQAIEPILANALAELPLLPPTPYRSTILPPSASASDVPAAGNLAGVRVEVDQYEPDIDSFGEEGVGLAEVLFHASSEVAVRVLADERGQRYSRKTIAPILMKAVGDAFMPGVGKPLWTDYATYWLALPGDEWRSRFLAKAEELRALGIPVLTPDERLPPEALAVVRAWRAATVAVAEAFRTAGDQPSRRPYELAFHFLHSMSNRLGLMPIEEAYFATLLGESTRAEPAT